MSVRGTMQAKHARTVVRRSPDLIIANLIYPIAAPHSSRYRMRLNRLNRRELIMFVSAVGPSHGFDAEIARTSQLYLWSVAYFNSPGSPNTSWSRTERS